MEKIDIKTIASMDTVLDADCIDFCPIKTFENLFVVGTYQYEHKQDKVCRSGQLYLLRYENNQLIKLDEKKMPGILDMRWCVHEIQGKILLGLVDAEGMLILYSLVDNVLTELSKLSISSGLSLYLDWSTRLIKTCTPSLVSSDSKGFLTLCSFTEAELKELQKFKAHDYEAWATSFNYWDPNIIYSGGDDCRFLAFDIRTQKSIFNLTAHSAGVTAIQPSLWKEEILFSGCYNGDLNTWDTRKMKSPLFTSNLSGGVWRLRCEPHHKPLIVASLMHEGFQVLKVDSNDKSTVLGTYSEHKSLAYGADWSWIENENKIYTIGSVSFYDHLFSLWEFNYEL